MWQQNHIVKLNVNKVLLLLLYSATNSCQVTYSGRAACALKQK